MLLDVLAIEIDYQSSWPPLVGEAGQGAAGGTGRSDELLAHY